MVDFTKQELERVFQALPGGALLLTALPGGDACLAACTPGTPGVLGMSEAEYAAAAAHGALALLCPEDRPLARQALADGFAARCQREGVYRVRSASGDTGLRVRANYGVTLEGRPACLAQLERAVPADASAQEQRLRRLAEDAGRAVRDRNFLAAAAHAMFSLCIVANLTKNTYYLIKYEDFPAKRAPESGVFDDLIRFGMETVGEADRTAFYNAFSRESLLAAHARGEKSVALIHSQRGEDGVWHRNRTTVIFVDDGVTGDVQEISLTDCLDGQLRTEEELKQKSGQLTAALAAAEKANHAKSDFLSSMSHDIRTPLNAIVNLTNLLHQELDDPQKMEQDIQKMEVASEFLLQLINDVLDISAIESGRLTLHPRVYTYATFLNYIKGIVVPLCENKDINFILDEGPTALDIYMDRVRFHQVFFNILSNAVKYTPPGGTVTFRTANNVVHDGILTCDFIVTDTGCGMSREFLDRAYEPFEREDTHGAYQGTGLGLSICKRLVDQMGGAIHIDSEPGKGTTVTVHMDLIIATEEQKAACQAELDSSYSRHADLPAPREARVLVVEDNDINREVLARLVERREYLVDCAENGKKALEMIEEKDGSYYQAVLMDIRMPVMDGLTATARIRALPDKKKSCIPIIAITADAFDNDARQCLNTGMNACLPKPIAPNELYNMLANYIQTEAPAPAGA